jgi:high-affinity Fe2+/Pb2+ permease
LNDREKDTNAFVAVAKIACGIGGFVLFLWTPQTGRGMFIYMVVLVLLVVVGVLLLRGKDSGYWPEKPEDRSR